MLEIVTAACLRRKVQGDDHSSPLSLETQRAQCKTDIQGNQVSH